MPCRGHLHRLPTLANFITLTRSFVSTVLFGVAFTTGNLAHLSLAVGVAVCGDLMDGFVARLMNQQSRFGAVFDLCADRLAVGLLFTYMTWHEPQQAVADLTYLFVAFMLDCPLSLMFLPHGLTSQSEFDRHDVALWKWNFSPLAKFMHSLLLPGLVLLAPPVIGTIGALISGIVRIWWIVRDNAF
ncbi:CDP-alcohol phosphatidyltransferase family protein [Nocardia colli]